MMESEEFYAWGIDTRSPEGHGLIGRYWWFNNHAPIIPSHMEGCKLAIFKTRKLARGNLPSVKSAYPNAQVVKVLVIIQGE